MEKRSAPFLFASIMAVAMGFMMSLFVTLVNTGLTSRFSLMWMRAIAVSVAIALPTSMLVAPFAQKLVGRIIKEQKFQGGLSPS
jgi:hypothetical protein